VGRPLTSTWRVRATPTQRAARRTATTCGVDPHPAAMWRTTRLSLKQHGQSRQILSRCATRRGTRPRQSTLCGDNRGAQASWVCHARAKSLMLVHELLLWFLTGQLCCALTMLPTNWDGDLPLISHASRNRLMNLGGVVCSRMRMPRLCIRIRVPPKHLSQDMFNQLLT
jgi:hypothetical protein